MLAAAAVEVVPDSVTTAPTITSLRTPYAAATNQGVTATSAGREEEATNRGLEGVVAYDKLPLHHVAEYRPVRVPYKPLPDPV